MKNDLQHHLILNVSHGNHIAQWSDALFTVGNASDTEDYLMLLGRNVNSVIAHYGCLHIFFMLF